MHEIGHIYLGHLDEICVELDNYLYNTIRENFYSIAERINANCGIDFGDVSNLELESHKFPQKPVWNFDIILSGIKKKVTTRKVSINDVVAMRYEFVNTRENVGVFFILR